MALFKKKPVVIEAITWDEFIEHGKKQLGEANLTESMPLSFDYSGYQVTHEDNECYLIPTLEGEHRMTPKDMLITGIKGEIYPCKIDIFNKTYEPL